MATKMTTYEQRTYKPIPPKQLVPVKSNTVFGETTEK